MKVVLKTNQVKPHTKARAKPIIKQVEVYEVEEPKPIKKQIPTMLQPSNPLTDITNHYQLLTKSTTFNKRKKNITIFVRICSPQKLEKDDNCETIIIINLLIKNDNII